MNNIDKQKDFDTQPKNKGDKKNEVFSALDINFDFLKLVPGFDAHMVRSGFYSAKYFIKTNEIMQDIEDKNQIVTMQIFQKTNIALLAGLFVVENLIKLCSGEYKDNNLAKQLMKEYMKTKELLEIEMQKQFEGNDQQINDSMENIINIQKQLLIIKKQLDLLWKSKIHEIEIVSNKKDGEQINAYESVLKIKGAYKYFAKLESVYLGILARATKVATNCKKIVDVANGKPVLFFADRFDMFNTQQLDGYSALLGGCAGVATDAGGYFYNIEGIGTMPHALIASFDGDTAQATLAYSTKFPKDATISLVDFENNCSKTAVESANKLKIKGKKLYGVRLDTSGTMIDEGVLFSEIFEQKIYDLDQIRLDKNSKLNLSKQQLIEYIRNTYKQNKQSNNIKDNSYFSNEILIILKKIGLTGVCKELVQLVRKKLDENGFYEVKIFVSGGFTAEKISDFEKNSIPVDGYGVGSTLLTTKYVESNGDFTADIVSFNGKPLAKIGRKEF